LRPVATDQLL